MLFQPAKPLFDMKEWDELLEINDGRNINNPYIIKEILTVTNDPDSPKPEVCIS